LKHQARFVGTDLQKDTYYNVAHGRLKLRQGTLESALIHYDCPASADLREGDTGYFSLTGTPIELLGAMLEKAVGTTVVVQKSREIYFIDNVKFHLDAVEGLGSFVEIEALDPDDTSSMEMLSAQCCRYKEALGIRDEDVIRHAYSDLLHA
jgi:adenylate cyclase class IV